jgi:hypothetical protein
MRHTVPSARRVAKIDEDAVEKDDDDDDGAGKTSVKVC